MTITVSLTQSAILGAIGGFLTAVLPSSVPIVTGQTNKVAEPGTTDFVVMWPRSRTRLETNTDSWADVYFTASISGTTMTVTAASFGQITVGATVWGVGLAVPTTVVAFGTGTGGVGTYTVSPSQNVSSETMACGATTTLTPMTAIFQLDFHGADEAADYVQIVTSLWRDQFAVDYFANALTGLAPLYTSEPQQIPFIDAESQYEDRWTLDVVLQVNPTVMTPQQFAVSLTAGLISVDATYH